MAKKRGDLAQLHVLVPEQLHEALKKRAAATKRTITAIVETALANYLARRTNG